MANKPQEAIDGIWGKYRSTLIQLISTLEENESLKKELDVNFSMPQDIAELEKRVEEKLAGNVEQQG